MSEDNQNTISIPIYAPVSREATPTPLFTPSEVAMLLLLVDADEDSLIRSSVVDELACCESLDQLPRMELPRMGLGSQQSSISWLLEKNKYNNNDSDNNNASTLYSSTNAILDLLLIQCAYFVLNKPRVAHLLQGNGKYSTPEERIQEIETRGIFIDGYGSHSKDREPALFLEIKHGSDNSDDDRNEYNQKTLRYFDDAGNQRSIEWLEGKNKGRDSIPLPPTAIWFGSKIKNMHLKNINAQEFKINFDRGIENCHLHSLKLNSLEFQLGADPSQSNIDHTIFSNISVTSLNIGSGITLNSCTFDQINVDYLTQHSCLQALQCVPVPGVAPITFNDCALRQFKVTHNEWDDADTEWDLYAEQPVAAYRESIGAAFGATAYLHNWAFYNSVCHDMDLPRSYLPTKYYFEDTSVINSNFMMPAEDAKHTTSKYTSGVPRGTLDVTVVATKPGLAYDFGILEAGYGSHSAEEVAPSLEDGATSIVLQSKFISSAPSVGYIPIGHWTNIHLSNTIFNVGATFNDEDKTCENLTVEGIDPKNPEVNRYLPSEWARFFNGDTSDPKRVEVLPWLNTKSLNISTRYLRALLQQAVVPENVEAIANVSKIQQTSTKLQTRLDANKTKGNKP